MKAYDRNLPDWFNRIRTRQLTLPRFQRHVAWGPSEVETLLNTVLSGLPAGAALLLNVGDEETFLSRTMTHAPTSGEKVTEQLLDGQQRLTALWCSLNDKYPNRTYFVRLDENSNDENEATHSIISKTWRKKNGVLYPLWIDDPKECWDRGLIPIHLLRPEDLNDEINAWVKASIPPMSDVDDWQTSYSHRLNTITELRTRVREFNLPYLALPAKTSRAVALDVFIKTNTSSVRLSHYDIVVAMVEDYTRKSLHEHVDLLKQAIPRASCYAELQNIVLDVVALKQNHTPAKNGYFSIDYQKMMNDWNPVKKGIDGMIQFLEELHVFDKNRLPSYPVMPVLAALWEYLPKQPDRHGYALRLLKKFAWRAFLTSRYERASATSSLQDFRALKKVILSQADESAVPMLNEELNPLPGENTLMQAKWPKGKTILGRGILALQTNCGAMDIATGRRATVAEISSREYHHLFPVSTLEDAGVPKDQISKALNCALIAWRTNRLISNKDPVSYLRERSEIGNLDRKALNQRLQTHLIPLSKFSVGYDSLGDNERRLKVNSDYEAFLYARSAIIATAIKKACDGQELDPNELIQIK